MKNYLIDTNILIRVITNDDITLSPKAKTILTNAVVDGYKLILTPLVIAECLYVLTSKTLYNLPRDKAVLAMEVVMKVKNLAVEDFQVILQAIKTFQETKLDFVDCYLLAKTEVQKLAGIKSFDKQITRRL